MTVQAVGPTTGPWGYVVTRDGRDWEIAPAAEIAVDNWVNSVCLVVSGNEADARLIVAAAELLEALRAVVAMYGPSADYGREARAVWEQAEAAIAKVEGHI